jgi:hypothetical protein
MVTNDFILKPPLNIRDWVWPLKRKEVQTGLSDGINIEVLGGITEQTKFKKLAQ